MDSLEGILLNKFPYQDKHLVGHILLRNGHKISGMFYGAQGGGKTNKGSILQLGHLFSVSVSTPKNHFEMLSVKEYSDKWHHRFISQNPKSFYILCFFCELLEKISPLATNIDDLTFDHSHSEGFFRLLSNAIFYLDSDLEKNTFKAEKTLFIFLAKALIELGIFPQTRTCAISGVELFDDSPVHLASEKGGFSHIQFLPHEEQKLVDSYQGLKIRVNLVTISKLKYGEIKELDDVNLSMCRNLFTYLCYQLHFNFNDFKTASLVF